MVSRKLPNRALREVANGIVDLKTNEFYPWQMAGLSGVTAWTGTPAMHRYIKKVMIEGYNVAAGTTSVYKLSANVGGATSRLATLRCIIGAEAAHYFEYSPGVLTDAGATITPAWDGGGWSDTSISIIYANIPADVVE